MFLVIAEVGIRGLINLIKTKGNWCNTVDQITYILDIDCDICPMLKANGKCTFCSGSVSVDNPNHVYKLAIEKFVELRGTDKLAYLLI